MDIQKERLSGAISRRRSGAKLQTHPPSVKQTNKHCISLRTDGQCNCRSQLLILLLLWIDWIWIIVQVSLSLFLLLALLYHSIIILERSSSFLLLHITPLSFHAKTFYSSVRSTKIEKVKKTGRKMKKTEEKEGHKVFFFIISPFFNQSLDDEFWWVQGKLDSGPVIRDFSNSSDEQIGEGRIGQMKRAQRTKNASSCPPLGPKIWKPFLDFCQSFFWHGKSPGKTFSFHPRLFVNLFPRSNAIKRKNKSAYWTLFLPLFLSPP